MAVVFKRLPAVTFCGMLIRPQSTAGRGEVHSEAQQSPSHFSLSASVLSVSSWLCLIWWQPLPLPFDSVGFKINISLHVLLITTNLNLYNSPLPLPFPTNSPPAPFSHSLASHAFHRKSTCPKLLWPLVDGADRPKASQSGWGQHWRWAGIKYAILCHNSSPRFIKVRWERSLVAGRHLWRQDGLCKYTKWWHH